MGRRVFAALAPALALVSFLTGAGFADGAAAETRSLKLYYLHTGEKADIAYKRNGKYIDSGLKKVNHFLRDWRRNEPTKIDPRLLDLVWEVYRESGSRDYIHIISGYRSPATNSMLRKRGRGVAKFSQHTLGKALDFFLPDVKLAKLREIGLKLGVGGVGFYPTSGSPFVHLDTGSVRHWPRMSRQELARIFPDGKTMHVPSDGKPLPGYEAAVAAYKARQARGGEIVVARADDKKKNSLFQQLFASTKEDEQDDEESNTVPAPRAVTTSPAAAPQPETVVASSGETRTAALAGVPIPSWAPRTATASRGTELAVAAPAAQQPAAAQPESDLPAATAEGQADAAGGAIELASIPIPEARPDYRRATVVAEAAPEPETAPKQTTIAALTAEEIENLRRTATPSQPSQPVIASVEARGPELSYDEDTMPEIRLASAALPAPQTSADSRLALFDEGADQEAEAISLPSVEQLEKLSVQPAERRGSVPETSPLLVSSISPMPQPRPVAKAAPRTLELALAASEEKSSSAGEAIRAMIEADARLRETARRDAEEAVSTARLVAAPDVPVPDRDPRPIAGKSDPPATDGAVEPAAASRMADAESSPDRQVWRVADARTLADSRSIDRIADIRAPAYGMSVMRGSPDSVLVAGFVAASLPQPVRGFAGNSVLVPDFVSFRSN